MLTQEDLQNIRVEVGEAFEQIVLPQFDRIDQRLERIESDIRDIRLEIGSLRRDLEALSTREKEDSGAFAHELLDMKRRLDALEQRVNQKEAAALVA